MIDAFEDHCWRDVIPEEVLDLYSHYKRPVTVGPQAALLAIDLYELAYQGGPRPVAEVSKTYPSSCGEYAWNAIEPTKRLFAAARAAGLPIIYTTSDTRPDSKPNSIRATSAQHVSRRILMFSPSGRNLRPSPVTSSLPSNVRAPSSGTPLIAHLTLLNVQTVIVCGESTSGCVRASTVDGYSHGFQMVMAEECWLRSQPHLLQDQPLRPASQIRQRHAYGRHRRPSRRSQL